MKKAEGYNDAVKDLIWIGDGQTKSCAIYMVQTLWPALVRELGRPEISAEIMEQHLVQYVESHRGTDDIPSDLETFAKLKQGRVRGVASIPTTPTTESMPSESSCCNVL